MVRLKDKVAIITGAAGDIGSAAARLFAREGARLVLADRDLAAVEKLAVEIGDAAVAIEADVTSPEDNAHVVALAVERFQRVDILLANAGIEGQVGAPIHASDPGNFDRVMAVNVRGAYLSLRAVLPVMIAAGGGSVVISSSVAGLVGVPGTSAYVTSKHALIGLARAAALEYASHKIRVNTVNPAPVQSRMMDAIEKGMAPGAAQAAQQAVLATIPSGRYARPAEVAAMMLFLASDDASFSTGANYLVDGGISAQ